jgi:cytochrome c biogenesis protein CcmG/thiol:disulfide interchange protein DsbE
MFCLASSIVFAIGSVSGAAAVVAKVNAAAPSFTLDAGGGKQFTLASFAHRPLVINVFASWCPPCRLELPGIIAAAHANAGSVAFLGVDEQEPVQMGSRFAHTMAIPYPVGFDAGQFAASYGAQSLPETIFVRADGTVSAIHHGPIDKSELKRRIAAISAST